MRGLQNCEYLKKLLQQIVYRGHQRSAKRCGDWSGKRIQKLGPKALLDVGCADGEFLCSYLDYKPELLCGIEAAPVLAAKAREKGIDVYSADLNGRWPFKDSMFDVVHSMQVIEHLHNTRMFAQEAFRVLKPGGTALIGSENLTSFLNTSAMLLAYTPFSLIRVCGWYLGNPLGLHYKEEVEEYVDIDNPAFAGVTGHIRVLSVMQAEELFRRIGFETKVSSIGLMPIPDSIGQFLERWIKRRGHYLLIEGRKPEIAEAAIRS